MENQSLQYNPKMVYRKIGPETVIVPTGDSIDSVRQIYYLNDTAAFVVDAIRAGRSSDQIMEMIAGEFEIDQPEELQSWVEGLISDLRSNNILL